MGKIDGLTLAVLGGPQCLKAGENMNAGLQMGPLTFPLGVSLRLQSRGEHQGWPTNVQIGYIKPNHLGGSQGFNAGPHNQKCPTNVKLAA